MSLGSARLRPFLNRTPLAEAPSPTPSIRSKASVENESAGLASKSRLRGASWDWDRAESLTTRSQRTYRRGAWVANTEIPTNSKSRSKDTDMAKLKFGVWIPSYLWPDDSTSDMELLTESIRKCEEY